MSRILYSGTRNASSWAFRAWLALREQDIAFEERIVDIRKPERFENLARIAVFSPPAAVPVLVDGETVIYDSLAIMEYASELGASPLLPADILARARARALLAWVHSGLSGLCGRLSFESAFYPQRRRMTTQEQAEAGRILAACQQALVHSGGPYLCGALSLADLAFVPVLWRLFAHDVDASAWPHAIDWSERLLSRPTVREWLHEAEALPPVYLDDYEA
ncbi:glutathione S-transferase family protein [Pseudoxanthomonas sp. PXM04]|uniref:glutathione S-transferase family protein n=1 Tax=Pseudoxanthomonas sp. PXM04 TaxID=2769297 RepID=UPI00177FE504|nr:glutathione S-transferase family protein [Pseudoxanthomonas sp. PXM04]MBD9377674.1 glutathione S-transferase family protein [Pseudoxanthomonas sp. PXM04]